jgi:sulfatase maturation enzyme AslB (radical SAM superfamily)
MKLTGITWIPTYNCNIDCDHCFFDTLGKQKYMDPDIIHKALDGFAHTKYMFWQQLSGGEIFLNEKKLFQIISNIRHYFNKNIGLSTNAFWARDEKQTRGKVEELSKSGVTGIALSADYYHQKKMDISGPKLLAKVLKESGLKTHSYLMGAHLKNDVTNAQKVNAITQGITSEINDKLDLPIAVAHERSIGKGSRINNPKKTVIPQGMCTELNTCLGKRSPFNPAMVWIDAYGNVMICYGIIIGNLHANSLNEIIANYKPNNYPLLEGLAQLGPKYLYKKAKQLTVKLPPAFFDECDVCYQSRVVLRKKYPELFGPDECYPEGLIF